MNGQDDISFEDPRDDGNGDVTSILAAYAGRTDTTQDDIVTLASRLKSVFASPSPGMAPATDPAQSVTRDRVTCLCCGKTFTALRRHLKSAHGLTEAAYREKYAIPEHVPLVAPSYSEKRAAVAKSAGFGKHARGRKAKS